MIANRIAPPTVLVLLALTIAQTTQREASAASEPTFALDDADALEGLEVEVASLPVELHRRAVDLVELGRRRSASEAIAHRPVRGSAVAATPARSAP